MNWGFGMIFTGDLGQTYSSNTTLSHLEHSGGQFLINAGDFSYADGYHPRWDTWGRMVTPYLSKVPMVFTYGNHEIESDVSVVSLFIMLGRFVGLNWSGYIQIAMRMSSL